MNNRNIVILIAIFIAILGMMSCKKDINGCTDPLAENYQVEANKDDGSCTFHGNLVPWYDNETRDSLLANNVASISVHVDNESFTNINPTVVLWSAEPTCSTTTIGNWITMKNIKSKTIAVLVKALDSSNAVVRQWNSSLTIESGTCELYKIVWN